MDAGFLMKILRELEPLFMKFGDFGFENKFFLWLLFRPL